MDRVSITTCSSLIEPDRLQWINQENTGLCKILKFEIADTGFYTTTNFAALQLTQNIVETTEERFSYTIDSQSNSVLVTLEIPYSEYTSIGEESINWLKGASIEALSHVLESYGCNTRALTIRRFQLRGADLQRKNHAIDSPYDAPRATEYTEDDFEFLISYETEGWPSESDLDKRDSARDVLEDILEGLGLGYVDTTQAGYDSADKSVGSAEVFASVTSQEIVAAHLISELKQQNLLDRLTVGYRPELRPEDDYTIVWSYSQNCS